MSPIVIAGNAAPHGSPVAGFTLPGPVVPRHPPSTLLHTTNHRSVSIPRPGPTIASHHPGASSGPCRAAWLSPVNA